MEHEWWRAAHARRTHGGDSLQRGSGGDPLAQPVELEKLTSRIKRELGYNIWCYTGYTWEAIERNPSLMAVMRNIDVLVDSPFILDQRNTKLRFRGSNNQRLIDVKETIAHGTLTLWHD